MAQPEGYNRYCGGLAQAGVGKVGNLLGSGAGLKAGTLANGIVRPDKGE